MLIIDQYNDDPVYAHLHVLTRDFPLARDLLKTASFESVKTAVDKLPSTAFAWEDERRFPIHTREDCIASIFYRSKLGSYVPEHVDAKLETARTVYGISEIVFARMKQASAPDTVYALPEEKRLPLSNAAQIKVAEEVLHRDYDLITLEKRADAFSRLHEAAQTHSVTLRPFSLKMAGVTVSNPALMRDWLEVRASVADEPAHKAAFEKLASATHKMPTTVVNRKDLVKLAITIAELDKTAGITKFYDRKIPDPLQTVFNTEKIAEDMCDVAGVQVPCSALMQLPEDVWHQVDASDLADVAKSGNAETFKQIFDTLPLDVKHSLREYVTNG